MQHDTEKARTVRVACHQCQRTTDATVTRAREPRPGEDERAVSVALCTTCGAAVYPRGWIGSPK